MAPAVGLLAETLGEGEVAAVTAAPAPVGSRAYIDPETGELTSSPSPEQVEALAQDFASGLNFSSVGLEPFELRSGGRGVFLEGRFLSASTVTVSADGSFEQGCSADPDHAATHADAPPVPEHQQPVAEPMWVDR